MQENTWRQEETINAKLYFDELSEAICQLDTRRQDAFTRIEETLKGWTDQASSMRSVAFVRDIQEFTTAIVKYLNKIEDVVTEQLRMDYNLVNHFITFRTLLSGLRLISEVASWDCLIKTCNTVHASRTY